MGLRKILSEGFGTKRRRRKWRNARFRRTNRRVGTWPSYWLRQDLQSRRRRLVGLSSRAAYPLMARGRPLSIQLRYGNQECRRYSRSASAVLSVSTSHKGEYWCSFTLHG